MLTLTKEDELLSWCKQKGVFSYVDVMSWKPGNYLISADRRIREFVEEGKLRRIPTAEAILRGLIRKGNAPLAWFEAA